MSSVVIRAGCLACVLMLGPGIAVAGDFCSMVPEGTPCDDGNPCTAGDTCQGGRCIPGPPGGGSCEDGNACTFGDSCNGTSCEGVPTTCDDQNACTDDSCDPSSGCDYVPNTAPCNDGNSCTLGEECSGGFCTGGAPLDCDDQNVCTTDSCFSGSCFHGGNPGQPCDDGSACTAEDICDFGQGTTCSGGFVGCDDGNTCTVDVCDPETGCANQPSPGAPCSDGNACTMNDTCDAPGTACISGPPVVCSAQDVCHVAGSCDPESGCSNPTVPDGTSCADADPCNGDESCQTGVCRSGLGPSCDDDDPCTTDVCDPQSGCAHSVLPDDTTCDDLDACDGLEQCQTGTCTAGTALDCADGEPCTEDRCFAIKRETRGYVEQTAASVVTEAPFTFVSPAGGLLVYVTQHRETYDHPVDGPTSVIVRVLEFAVDPERVAWIVENGSPRAILPGERFELRRTRPYGASLEFDYLAQPAAAHDLGDGRTRVLVPYAMYEGGCTFINQLGGPECQLPPEPVADLNGDSDPFDGMVAYSAIEIDRATRTILDIEHVVTDTEGSAQTMATNGRTIVHINPEAGDADCTFPSGSFGYCFMRGARADRNGDGHHDAILALHDVDTNETRLSFLRTFWDLQDATPEVGGDLVAFESLERWPDRDYSGDGDFNDIAIRYTSIAELFAQPTLTPRLGPIGSFLAGPFKLTGVEGSLLTYLGDELRLFHADTKGDVTTRSPASFYAEGAFQLAGGIEAFSTPEGGEVDEHPGGADYNGDGDRADTQLRFYEHATRTIVTTNVTQYDSGGNPTEARGEATSDGEILAYSRYPAPFTSPTPLDIRFIRVAPCAGAPCGEEGEHCSLRDEFDGTPCPDGDACNGEESCSSGTCQPGSPVTCQDFNECTDDSCVEGGCEYVPHSDACDDFDACTISDQCAGGFCSGVPRNCDDANVCTSDSCDPSSGCHNLPHFGPCDDGDACTIDDACNSETCAGAPVAPPGEVQDIRATGDSTLDWLAVSGATGYEVLRGLLSALPVGPGGGDELCLGAVPSPPFTDAHVPAAGSGIWYLIRALDDCGPGGWGAASGGGPRASTTCP